MLILKLIKYNIMFCMNLNRYPQLFYMNQITTAILYQEIDTLLTEPSLLSPSHKYMSLSSVYFIVALTNVNDLPIKISV